MANACDPSPPYEDERYAGNRAHPLEYLALGLGTPMALALMGASDEVFIVSAAFGMWNGKFNHANLPMVSMPVWDWFFATAQRIIVIMHWSAAKQIPTTVVTSFSGTASSAPVAAMLKWALLAQARVFAFPSKTSCCWPFTLTSASKACSQSA